MTYRPSKWTPQTSFDDTFIEDGVNAWHVDADKAYQFTSPDDNILRFEVRSGDVFSKPGYSDPSTVERAEAYDALNWVDGSAIQFSYDFMIDPGAKNTAQWMVLGQLHADANYSPPIAVNFNGNDRMTITGNYTDANGNVVYRNLWVDTSDIGRGRWYNMKFDIKFDGVNTGHVYVWRDGVQIVQYDGLLGYDVQTKTYWREGIYRKAAAETMVVSYKNFDIAPFNSQILDGSVGDDILNGSLLNDAISGFAGNDRINGLDGNDSLTGGVGNDVLDGGAGVDVSIYMVARALAAITRNLDGSVTIADSLDGTDTLLNMEWAQFTDGKIYVGPQRNDTNNDNRSDVLWQGATGEGAIWEMNGASIVGGGAFSSNPGLNWRLVGAGDFTGDRKADLLWQKGDGQVCVWQMDGAVSTRGFVVGVPGPEWRAVCVADFNKDGVADIAFQSTDGTVAIWNMNGGVSTGGGAIPSNPGTSWRLVTAGDFNADGMSELLFQNVDGSMMTWEINSSTLAASHLIAPNPGGDWHVKGVGDFNQDGRSDIVMQRDNGDIAVWCMSDAGTILGAAPQYTASPGLGWNVGQVGDYDGNGVADILTQNSTSGGVSMLSLTGSSFTNVLLAANPGAAWHTIA